MTEIDDLRQRVDSTADQLAEHETRLDLMFKHHETVAVQVAALGRQIEDMRRDVPTMVAQGIVAAAGDPATWEALRSGMRKSAEKAAGGWVLGTIRWAAD